MQTTVTSVIRNGHTFSGYCYSLIVRTQFTYHGKFINTAAVLKCYYVDSISSNSNGIKYM